MRTEGQVQLALRDGGDGTDRDGDVEVWPMALSTHLPVSSPAGVAAAARRAATTLKSATLLMLAPLFCYEVGYQLLLFAFRRAVGERHILIEFVVMVLLGFPMALVAEAVLARMLWVLRGGRRPGMAQVREVLRAPGLTGLWVRLAGLMTACFLLAGILLLLWFGLGLMTKAFFFSWAHPGVKVPKSHGSSFGLVLQFALIAAVLVSRYSYVLPLFAAAGRSEKGLLQRAVTLARLAFVPLAVLSMAEYGLVFSLLHWLRPLAVGGWLRVVAVTGLSAVLTAAVATGADAVKAELAFGQLDAPPRADEGPDSESGAL